MTVPPDIRIGVSPAGEGLVVQKLDVEAVTRLDARSFLTTAAQTKHYIGNATSSDFDDDPNIPDHTRQYFGLTYAPLTGRPQATVAWAKYLGATPDDSAQGGSAGAIMRHLSQALADAGVITQAEAITGNEGDALQQGRVNSTGLVVGVSAIAQLQNMFGYSPTASGRVTGFYVASPAARDAGSLVYQSYGLLHDGARTNGVGTVREAWTVYGKDKIQTERELWVGTFLTGGTLQGAVLAGATSLTVQTGEGANFTGGSVQQVVIGDGSVAEVKTITTVVGDVISFSALTNAHAAGEIIRPTQAANLRYSAGALKTDYSLVTQLTMTAAQYAIQNTNGTGTLSAPFQTSTPSAPSAGRIIHYTRNSDGRPVFKTSGNVEYALLHLSAPAAAIASPSADVAALKTAVDAVRVAIQNAGITS